MLDSVLGFVLSAERNFEVLRLSKKYVMTMVRLIFINNQPIAVIHCVYQQITRTMCIIQTFLCINISFSSLVDDLSTLHKS